MFRPLLAVAFTFTFTVAAGGHAQDTSCRTASSTFELIHSAIFERGCTQSYCHGEARVYGLDLRAEHAYENALRFVEPGSPQRSPLWYSLAKKTLGPDLPRWLADLPGEAMPIGAVPLDSDELEALRLWILAGAPKDEIVAGVSDLIDLCPPPTPRPGEYAIPPPCDPDDPDLLLPDLVIDPPGQVRVIYRGTNRIISFNTEIGNTGAGPLIIQAGSIPTGPGASVDAIQIIHKRDGSQCSRPAGAAFYQYEGKDWSYADIAYFELRKDDPDTGEVVARRYKDYYCLADTDPIRGYRDAPHQYEMHCEDLVGRMGISVGYKDTYHRSHPGQWIDLDEDPTKPVPAGTYYLVQVVDQNQFLMESDDSRQSNANYVRITVPFAVAGDPSMPASSPTRANVFTPTRTKVQQPVRPERPPRPQKLSPTRPLRPARPTRTSLMAPEIPTPTPSPRRGEAVITFDNHRLEEIGPVTFSHLGHKALLGDGQFRCDVCHGGSAPLFEMRARAKGESRFTMKDLEQGRACGGCHNGRTAFNSEVVFDVASHDNCVRCHPNAKAPARPDDEHGPQRPIRPSRPIAPVRPGRAVAEPPTATPRRVPTATPQLHSPERSPAGSDPCAGACDYDVSQMRLTWYDHTGLGLSLYVGGRNCPALTPAAGEQVSLRMTRWLKESREETGLRYDAILTLADAQSASSGDRVAHLEKIGDGTRITYEAGDPALARAEDGIDFPVAFELCVTVGDQAVKASLVCQPKNTGLLCH